MHAVCAFLVWGIIFIGIAPTPALVQFVGDLEFVGYILKFCAPTRTALTDQPLMGVRAGGGYNGDEHRAPRSPVQNRGGARNFDRRTPPPAPVDREPRDRRLTSPREGDYAAAGRRHWPDQHRLPSPPLAERPRLATRPPPLRRQVGYAPPAMARGSGHRADEEFDYYPHRDRPQPGCGDRSPPRHC